jgi:hypothetical protein
MGAAGETPSPNDFTYFGCGILEDELLLLLLLLLPLGKGEAAALLTAEMFENERFLNAAGERNVTPRG